MQADLAAQRRKVHRFKEAGKALPAWAPLDRFLALQSKLAPLCTPLHLAGLTPVS
jgi:hypothetical protein